MNTRLNITFAALALVGAAAVATPSHAQLLGGSGAVGGAVGGIGGANGALGGSAGMGGAAAAGNINGDASLPSTSGATRRAANRAEGAVNNTQNRTARAADSLPGASVNGSASANANGNSVKASDGTSSTDIVNGANTAARNATGRTEGAINSVPGRFPSSVNGSVNASGGVSAQ